MRRQTQRASQSGLVRSVQLTFVCAVNMGLRIRKAGERVVLPAKSERQLVRSPSAPPSLIQLQRCSRSTSSKLYLTIGGGHFRCNSEQGSVQFCTTTCSTSRVEALVLDPMELVGDIELFATMADFFPQASSAAYCYSERFAVTSRY